MPRPPDFSSLFATTDSGLIKGRKKVALEEIVTDLAHTVPPLQAVDGVATAAEVTDPGTREEAGRVSGSASTQIADGIQVVHSGSGRYLTNLKDHSLCLKGFHRLVTCGALVATAPIDTDRPRHGHRPRVSKGLEVLRHVAIWQLELICFVIVKIAAQTTGFAVVVSRDSDQDVVDQIVRDPQSKDQNHSVNFYRYHFGHRHRGPLGQSVPLLILHRHGELGQLRAAKVAALSGDVGAGGGVGGQSLALHVPAALVKTDIVHAVVEEPGRVDHGVAVSERARGVADEATVTVGAVGFSLRGAAAGAGPAAAVHAALDCADFPALTELLRSGGLFPVSHLHVVFGVQVVVATKTLHRAGVRSGNGDDRDTFPVVVHLHAGVHLDDSEPAALDKMELIAAQSQRENSTRVFFTEGDDVPVHFHLYQLDSRPDLLILTSILQHNAKLLQVGLIGDASHLVRTSALEVVALPIKGHKVRVTGHHTRGDRIAASDPLHHLALLPGGTSRLIGRQTSPSGARVALGAALTAPEGGSGFHIAALVHAAALLFGDTRGATEYEAVIADTRLHTGREPGILQLSASATTLLATEPLGVLPHRPHTLPEKLPGTETAMYSFQSYCRRCLCGSPGASRSGLRNETCSRITTPGLVPEEGGEEEEEEERRRRGGER
ncbi:hypothetical protein EYF80_025998 [Liparis tanakae]|uniref:Uncharacterized protein n=1 Tax=Liparis tanakae TaxID=230148 RepID=A0A4Z2HDL4_9TELE|nr:hypothetical protein EYF80_025998 [Liparis tanakae]